MDQHGEEAASSQGSPSAGGNGTNTPQPILSRDTGLRLDELLHGLQEHLQYVITARDRLHRLLEAVMVIGSDLSLGVVLRKIVEAALDLVDARYGAVGVVGEHGGLDEFIHVGMDDDTVRAIGPLPEGKGILGRLIVDPQPLRLHDLSADSHSVGFPANHPPMKTFLGVPLRVRGEVFGNLYLSEKGGGRDFDEEDEHLITALAAGAGIIVENARLFEAAQRRERWLHVSAEITDLVISDAPLDDVLDAFVERVREMAGADYASVTLPADEPDRLIIRAAHGDAYVAEHQGRVFSVENSISGEVMATGQTVLVPDASADERDHQPLVASGIFGCAMVVPVGRPGGVMGTVQVANVRDRGGFAAEVQPMTESLAAQVALALHHAQIQEDRHRLAMLEDRDRIARDLHDVVIQRLFASGMSLQGGLRLVREPQLAGRLQQVVDEIDDIIRDIRSTIFGLRTQSDDRAGLLYRISYGG